VEVSETRWLGELKRVQRDCDKAYEAALAGLNASMPSTDAQEQSQQCKMVLLEARLNQFEQAVEEKLQTQRRDFEQRLQRISSSTAIAAAASESSIIQYGERLSAAEGLLEDQVRRGKALTEGVMHLGAHFKHLDLAAAPTSGVTSQQDLSVAARLEDLTSRLECQELAHARLYATIIEECGACEHQAGPCDKIAVATTQLAKTKWSKLEDIQAMVNKLTADMLAIETDATLGPQIAALMESVRHVAPKLREHDHGLRDINAWREEQLKDMRSIEARTATMEQQLEQSLSSTQSETNALAGDMLRLKYRVDKICSHTNPLEPK
jgi:hypothetical protein